MKTSFDIAGQKIGDDAPTFIIAELSANHNQQLSVALDTIKAAKQAGANAIKLQTYTADTITLNSSRPEFVLSQGTIWDGRTLYDLYKEAHTPWDWHATLFEAAAQEGLICFSSPFDPTAVDLLESLGAPAYKIASFEITDIPLIGQVAATGKPVIVSTGIADAEDISLALDTIRQTGNRQIGLLKCTSSYPAPLSDANLEMIRDFEQRFQVVPGLSDHTLGTVAPVVAVAMGAKIIEKHFILDKALGGPDATFSLDPKEFLTMTNAVRDAEKTLGTVDYSLNEKMIKSREFSRSLFTVVDIPKGTILTENHVRSIRPGHGMHPKFLPKVLGKKAKTYIERGTPLSWDLIQ